MKNHLSQAEHRHFQKENDSNSTYYLDNEASVYEDIYGQMDQSPKASPQKSRPLSRERIPESQHLTSYQEIPPFQRKRLEFSVSKNNLNETLLGNDPSIDISHVNRGTNLSLTYLPAIRVQSPSMKKPFGPSDRYSSSDLKNDKSNSSQKLEPLSKKTLILIPNSSAGKDQLQLPLHSRDLDDDPPEFSPHYTPKKQPQKTIFKEDRPQDLVSSARERMVNKIQRFLPDNPSIEERMVESSKRSVQEPEVKRLSQLGQTSGSNENSSLRNNDKTDNMNLTKISDGNASQPANPSLPLPTIQETGDKSPKKERKNENSGTLIKHFASPMSPGPTFIKGKLLQARRSEGPLTNRQTIKAFQAKNSSRRVSPSLTIAGKSANQQPMFSPQMKDLFSRPENEPGSKDTPPDSSQKEDSKVTPPQLKPQKGSSDELDLYSHRSEIEPSRASDPLSKDNRADPFHSGLNKANKNKVRPDWKSEDESEMRFITYSDD
jgi:hypothetical protein